LGRLVRWWHERTFERESRAHQRQSDAKTNQAFSDSYTALPVSLVAIVSADLYVGGEVPTLDRHLTGFLPAGRHMGEGRDQLHEFLRAAEATVGGGSGTRASYYNVLEPGWPTTQKVDWLPPEVQSVHLTLRTLSTGIVMFGVFVVPSSRHPDLIAKVFEASHPSPTKREKGGTVTYTVDTAKSRALRQGLEGMLEFGIFPPNAGLLRDRRYPAASLVVLDVAALPDEGNEDWRTLRRVLEVQHWHRWDGTQERLYAGLPVGDIGSFWDRQSGGWSLLTAAANHPDGKSAAKESLHALRHDLWLGIGVWFSWIAALQAAVEIGKQADQLRASLDRERKGAFRFLRVRTLEPLVDSLQECLYRLSRLQQASIEERRYIEFPKMLEHRQPASKENATGPGTATPPNRSFGDALASWIQTAIETGLQGTRLSLDRASTLVQLRTNAAMRAWTIVLVALTLAVVFLTAAVVVIALRTAH
jgi:hypothetical protein